MLRSLLVWVAFVGAVIGGAWIVAGEHAKGVRWFVFLFWKFLRRRVTFRPCEFCDGNRIDWPAGCPQRCPACGRRTDRK